MEDKMHLFNLLRLEGKAVQLTFAISLRFIKLVKTILNSMILKMQSSSESLDIYRKSLLNLTELYILLALHATRKSSKTTAKIAVKILMNLYHNLFS